LTHSKSYRIACRSLATTKTADEQAATPGENSISKSDFEDILIAYKNLALGGCGDNYHVQEKAGRFLIEEYNGRNERRVKAQERGNYSQLAPRINIGAIVLNQQLEKSREAKKKSLELLAIDV
jgi:hypothetical protein